MSEPNCLITPVFLHGLMIQISINHTANSIRINSLDNRVDATTLKIDISRLKIFQFMLQTQYSQETLKYSTTHCLFFTYILHILLKQSYQYPIYLTFLFSHKQLRSSIKTTGHLKFCLEYKFPG